MTDRQKLIKIRSLILSHSGSKNDLIEEIMKIIKL